MRRVVNRISRARSAPRARPRTPRQLAWRTIVDLIEIIHAGTAEGAVGGRKAGGLDDVRLDPEACGQPKNRAGVLRNIGLDKARSACAAQRISGHATGATAYDGQATYATFGLCGTHGRDMPHLHSPGKGANRTPLD